LASSVATAASDRARPTTSWSWASSSSVTAEPIERLHQAAMELFLDRGFAQTTAGDIAERAGVTERTFFRYFADKREVLFDGSQTMNAAAVEATLAAPADASPLDAALDGMTAAATMLEDRHEHAGRRSRVIADSPTLKERELLTLASMTEAVAEALRSRGTPDPAAPLAAHTAVAAFHVAFAQWVAAPRPGPLATLVATAATELRALT
jgi:AcrR family transcriptional regulator